MLPRRSLRLSGKKQQIQECSYKSCKTVKKPVKHSDWENESVEINSSKKAQSVGNSSSQSDDREKKGTGSKSSKRGRLIQGDSDDSKEGPNILDNTGCHSPTATSDYTIGTSVIHMLSSFDDSTDLDEIDSASNLNGQVGKYSVKPELVPVLRCIMDKHGDIAEHYQLQSKKLLTCALEEICMVVQELESIKFTRLKEYHLSSLVRAISVGEILELNVKWLRKRYDDLTQGYSLVKEYKRLKDTLKERAQETEINRKSIEFKKAEVAKLQSEINQLDNRGEVLENEIQTVKTTVSDISVAIKEICNKCLMDGLF